ncbi:MAG: ATP-binding protein [Armatimonadetes bacterium]|nr:ATP-binding protein [Armatimonadota bacterium]
MATLTESEVLFLHALEQVFPADDASFDFEENLSDLGYVRALLGDSVARLAFYESRSDSRFHPSNIGEDRWPLVGRDFEVKLIESQFQRGLRVVNLTGRGGMGKSRIAREIGRRFGASAWVISCHGVESGEELRLRIGAQIGLAPSDEFEAELRDESCLLILDNLERGALLAGLMESLATAPRVRLLVLSRKPVAALAECRIELQSLSLHHAREFARSLLGSGVPDGLMNVLPRLSRAPLALIIAASLLVAEPASATNLAKLSPATSSAAADNRILVESMNRLTSPQLTLLHALAEFESSVLPQAAIRVTELVGCTELDLQKLQSAAFVDADLGSIRQLRVHDLIREQVRSFARSRGLADQQKVSHQVHATVIRELALTVGEQMKEDRWSDGIALFHAIRPDCRKAIQNAESLEDSSTTIAVATGVGRTLFELGFIPDFKLISASGIASARRNQDQTALIELLGLAGAIAGREGNEAKCTEIWQERLALARTVGDRTSEADALSDLAWQAFELSDFAAANRHLDESIQIATEDRHLELLATGLVMRARVFLATAKPEEADSAIAAVEALLPECKNRDLTSFVYYSLAGASLQREDFPTAERWLKTLLRQASEGQLAIMLGWSLRNLAPIFERRLDSNRAVACLVAAVQVHQEYMTKHRANAIKALHAYEDKNGLTSSTQIVLAMEQPWLELVELVLSETPA